MNLVKWGGVVGMGMLLNIASVNAKKAPVARYFDAEHMPQAVAYMPAPPDTASARFGYDREQYDWGVGMRNTERGKIARTDAAYSVDKMLEIYGEVIGIELNGENAPKLKLWLTRAERTAGAACGKIKNHYRRTRPYDIFDGGTSVPEEEATLRHNGSYPSGHTTLGWTTALLLAEIAPEYGTDIIKRGFEYGQSRVIAGFHYQSDVDAARVIAGVSVSQMHRSKDFLKDKKRAEKELARLLKNKP